MEWYEHRLLGDSLGAAMALGDDEVGQSQRIRQEDELLADVGAKMTRASEEQYPGEPFRLGKPNVAGTIVEMPDKRGHDLLGPGIRSRGYATPRFLGHGQFVELAHCYFQHPRSSVHATAVIRLTGRPIRP